MSLVFEELMSADLAGARNSIEQHLAICCQFDEDCPSHLAEAIRYTLLAPGKRLRPLLVLLATAACGKPPELAMPAACAVEMIHAYSLIHDDLPAMDDDDLRRGRPSCHIQFDEATAILAGDALQAMAFETLAKGVQPGQLASECVRVLARASGPGRLVGGQADDLAGMDLRQHRQDSNESEIGASQQLAWLEQVHRRKTGALITVSLELGGRIGQASEKQLIGLQNFGRNLGLAFQITDDLLDLCGNQAKIGKPVGSDAGKEKLTYPSLLGTEESQRRATSLIEEALEQVALFGEAGAPLRSLARILVNRNS